ncbi:MAG: ABC transporter family substrate-binding protein [Burkholderiaceae bacterium]|nr:ABC transporter family substrate-binding protein [Microbacteriaceae bacterium]
MNLRICVDFTPVCQHCVTFRFRTHRDEKWAFRVHNKQARLLLDLALSLLRHAQGDILTITRPRRRRLFVGIAGIGVAALALTGCTTTAETDTGGDASTVRIAETNELSSFNNLSSTGNVDINSQIAYFTQSDFFYLDTTPEVVYDEGFGTVELVSEDPLSVKYTVNEGQVWSDGEAIDADDMLVGILSRTGFYDDEAADESAGSTYFSPAGSTAGLRLASFPEVGDEGQSITITYETPYADWNLISPISLPAHVIAENAGVAVGDDFIALLEAVPQGDVAAPVAENADIRAIADFWNNGYDTATLPGDASLYLASGPYIVDSWDAGQSVTLVRNAEYQGTLEPEFDQVVVRFIADPTAQVQALQNGEVDIINPQASADTLASLEGIEGVEVQTGVTGSYDHIDLNFTSEVFQDANVREAFLKTIPREQLVDALIRPLDPAAEVYDSQIFFPGVPGFDEATASNGSANYAEVDIDGARELLAGATPTVRIAYNNANPNRLDSFLAMQANAQEAGFVIVDGGLGADAWGAALGVTDSWDAFIFGWSTVGAGVNGVPQLYSSTSASNFGKWSNPEADALMVELVKTTDPEEQIAIQLQIEEHLWADGFGLPLFILPGVQATGPAIANVSYNAWQTGPIWNYWEWTTAS